MILGLDTSCYTTSAALFDGAEAREARRPLRLPPGQKGLRQSGMLFQHINALPEVLAELGGVPERGLTGVAASSRPREAEGSYMPCFLAGLSLARSLSAILDIPLYEASHQQGHLAAALWSAGRMDLAAAPFLAWHVSGGTTELLYTEPYLKAERIGGTTDLCAGQVIDRVGAALGLGFPAGPELERLAERSGETLPGRLTVNGMEFSLSGLQNQAERFLAQGRKASDVAAFTLGSVARVLRKATDHAKTRYPGVPVVGCGGVLANLKIRGSLPDVVFAAPSASPDNAVGIAVIGERYSRLPRREVLASTL
ncbi:MAG: DNA-binding protein [Oscillospiraceae bacterium]|nr:DNA-binding protein [Oscillospiraceae bacterium]